MYRKGEKTREGEAFPLLFSSRITHTPLRFSNGIPFLSYGFVSSPKKSHLKTAPFKNFPAEKGGSGAPPPCRSLQRTGGEKQGVKGIGKQKIFVKRKEEPKLWLLFPHFFPLCGRFSMRGGKLLEEFDHFLFIVSHQNLLSHARRLEFNFFL